MVMTYNLPNGTTSALGSGSSITPGLFMGGTSAFASAISAYGQASLSRDAYAFQAEIAAFNSRIADMKARYAKQAGIQQEVQHRLKVGQLKGKQRSALASGNIDITSGTAARVLDSTDVMGEIDAITIQANALKAAWGYSTEAANYTNDSIAYSSAAKATSPSQAAFTSLLGSANQVASKWYAKPKADSFGSFDETQYLQNAWRS